MFESRHDISNNVVYATNKASDQPAHENSLTVKLPTKQNFEFLRLLEAPQAESIHVKMPHYM